MTSPLNKTCASVVRDSPAKPPSYDARVSGEHVTIVAVRPDHASDLYELFDGPGTASLFDYLFDYPPTSLVALQLELERKASTTNPWTFTILLNERADASSRAVGMASLMRMDLPNRVIEVGNILFTPALQRTRAATEAMYLLARYVFEELGFRRYEWKCNSVNEPSRRAATRLGFVYEGTFRQHMITKGRNRDTTWFAMLDTDWPDVKMAFKTWLDRSNFDAGGVQKRKLEDLRSM